MAPKSSCGGDSTAATPKEPQAQKQGQGTAAGPMERAGQMISLGSAAPLSRTSVATASVAQARVVGVLGWLMRVLSMLVWAVGFVTVLVVITVLVATKFA